MSPQPVDEKPKPQSLDEKLAAKAATVKDKANRIKLEVSADQEMDELVFSCSLKEFLAKCKPSSTGDSEGLMMDLSGMIQYKLGSGAVVDVITRHSRGGGAWVAIDIQPHRS